MARLGAHYILIKSMKNGKFLTESELFFYAAVNCRRIICLSNRNSSVRSASLSE